MTPSLLPLRHLPLPVHPTCQQRWLRAMLGTGVGNTTSPNEDTQILAAKLEGINKARSRRDSPSSYAYSRLLWAPRHLLPRPRNSCTSSLYTQKGHKSEPPQSVPDVLPSPWLSPSSVEPLNKEIHFTHGPASALSFGIPIMFF